MNTKIINTDTQKFEEDVIKSDLPVVVYFYSDDCPPCLVLNPVYDRFADMYQERMKFVKISRPQNRQLAEKYSVKSSPTLMFFKNGQEVCSRLTGYVANADIKQSIENVAGGACNQKKKQKIYADVLILGGGPAGLSAAMYAARAKLLTVVVDEGLTGGQVSTTYHIANYPGTNGVVRGLDLMENMKKQALDFGAQIDDLKVLKEINFESDEKYVATEDTDYYARCVIIASGAQPRKLPAEGENEFRGRGVHYCATCDGAMYQDANLIVVGGGESAAEESIFLTRYAKHITIVHRSDSFSASKASQDEVLNNPNINVLWNSAIVKVNGDNFVKSVTIEDVKTRELREMEIDGIFVYIGMQPRTELFKGWITLTDSGYIPTDEDMRTNVPGVFAVGDVREKKVRQIATATADGVIAGIMAEKYINGKLDNKL